MLNFVILFSISLFVYMGKGQSNDGDFDVTKFGAMPNTEIFQVKMLNNTYTID